MQRAVSSARSVIIEQYSVHSLQLLWKFGEWLLKKSCLPETRNIIELSVFVDINLCNLCPLPSEHQKLEREARICRKLNHSNIG